MDKTFLYFAYGSDMSLPQMRGRMLDAEVVLDDDARSAARLDGYKLNFDRALPQHETVGHANLAVEAGAVTEGVLYELPSHALAVLDAAEGVSAGYSQRITVTVRRGDASCEAYAYVATADWVKPGLLPSRNHLYRLLSAQRYLSAEYFAALRAIPALKVAVDDEGMPHAVKKKLKEMAALAGAAKEKDSPSIKPLAPRAQKSKAEAKPAKEKVEEKKKYYPPVGAYAPKSANAFRKAYGIPPKKNDGDEASRAPSPWSKGAGRRDERRDERPAGRSDRPAPGRGSASRDGKASSPWGAKTPRKPGRPW